MVLFVASNPSHLNKDPKTPFVGSKSEKKFNEWADFLVPKGNYKVINVSDKVTEDNKKLKKSEYDLARLCTYAIHPDIEKIVALGNTASEALECIGVEFFKLPHPSPLNRKLNNEVQLNAVLEECKKWINNQNDQY